MLSPALKLLHFSPLCFSRVRYHANSPHVAELTVYVCATVCISADVLASPHGWTGCLCDPHIYTYTLCVGAYTLASGCFLLSHASFLACCFVLFFKLWYINVRM